MFNSSSLRANALKYPYESVISQASNYKTIMFNLMALDGPFFKGCKTQMQQQRT